jgi:putative tricarboxylic transport membrane protein
LGGWRGLAVPPGTPPERIEVLTGAIRSIVEGETKVVQVGARGKSLEQTFPQFMQQQGFDNTWRPREEFATFLAEQDEKFGRLLSGEGMQSVGRDPFPAWAFPTVTATLAGLLIAGLLAQRWVLGRASKEEDSSLGPPPRRGIVNFAAVLAAMVFYLLAAETLGFVLTVGLLLLALLWLFGTRWWLGGLIAFILTPLIYQLFANVLRVPLPRGWFGW